MTLKSPVNELPLRFPHRSPYGKRCPFPEPSFTYPSGSPSTFPSPSSHRERSFLSRVSFVCLPRKQAPLPYSPTVALCREMPLSRAFFYIIPGVPNRQGFLIKQNLTFLSQSQVKKFPPRSPNGATMERDAPFAEPIIYSFINISQSLQLRNSQTQQVENLRSPSMGPHAGGQHAYNVVRPGTPRGSFSTLLLLPQCHALFSTIPSTLPWVDQNPVSQQVW